METYRTDEEQIEAVKQWWKENGVPIVVGLVLGLGGIFGWRGWQAFEQQQAEAASDLYQTLINSMREKNDDRVREAAQLLLDEYESTTYAIYASLNLARLDVDDGNFASAEQHLRYAAQHAPANELRLLANLRLARVLLAEDKLDEALQILESRDFGEFSDSAAELKGDILVRKGNAEDARDAYNTALARMSPGSKEYELLSLKLDSVN